MNRCFKRRGFIGDSPCSCHVVLCPPGSSPRPGNQPGCHTALRHVDLALELTVQRAVCAQSSVFVHCQRIEPGRGTPAFRQGVRSLVRLRGLELIAIALPGVHCRHRHWHMGAIDQGKAGRQDRGRGSPTPPPGWSPGDGGTVGYERELQQPLAGSWPHLHPQLRLHPAGVSKIPAGAVLSGRRERFMGRSGVPSGLASNSPAPLSSRSRLRSPRAAVPRLRLLTTNCF